MKPLFGRYTVQTHSKLVRVPKPDATIIEEEGPLIAGDPLIGPELVQEYVDIAKDFITHTAITVGAVYCVCKIVGRICK
jgi:hypothetical protein